MILDPEPRNPVYLATHALNLLCCLHYCLRARTAACNKQQAAALLCSAGQCMYVRCLYVVQSGVKNNSWQRTQITLETGWIFLTPPLAPRRHQRRRAVLLPLRRALKKIRAQSYNVQWNYSIKQNVQCLSAPLLVFDYQNQKDEVVIFFLEAIM